MLLPVHKREQVIVQDRAIRLWPWLDSQCVPEDNWGFGDTLQQPEWVNKAKDTKDGRIFIFGTGPSLSTQLPLLHRLKDEDTWTVNRMAQWEELPFTPTYHSITEPGPIGNWGLYVHKIYDFPKATQRIAIHWFPVRAEGWLWCAKAHDDVQVRWEGWFGLGDSLPPLPTAWASPLTLGQLACWFGYKELIYLGIDTTQTGQAWDVKTGRTAQVRSILSILECADRARCQIEASGRKIIDCTPGGRLNQEGVLPYVPLEEVLADGRS